MSEALVIVSNCFVGIVTIHLAHRSLPDERKHWLRQRARCCLDFALIKAGVEAPYRGAHRRPQGS
jgi:hypothetical protein